ncbi:MAG: ABC transporter permease [Ekhidna sp.]
MKFHLEESIKNWRAQLRKHSGFEDADIDELEDHFRIKIANKVRDGLSPDKAYEQVLQEDYKDLDTIAKNYLHSRSNTFLNRGLFQNYLKVGLRSFARTKTYFAMNLFGLIVGLTSVFYIIFYIHYELNYDSFHENSDQIYRVNTLMERASGSINYPIIPPAVGPASKEAFAEIEKTARVRYAYDVLMQHENQSFYEEKVFFAEPTFLEMFSFHWKAGRPANALSEINTIVLTNAMSTKYFGNENPLGKIITYNNEIDLKVVGVIEDVPEHSHFSFDFLISFETFKPGPGALEPMTSWRWLGFLTYVQLVPEADPEVIEKKILDLFEEHRNPSNTSLAIQLQPLSKIYLTSGNLSNPQGGLFKVNDIDNLISLGVIAVLIILISFFNYFNITSALMRMRSKEIGIRKVFGSSRRKVFAQMGSETLIIVGLAVISSWLAIILMNQSNMFKFLSDGISISILVSIGIVILFTLLSGILFGSAFSSYSAMALLKNKFISAPRNRLSAGSLILLLQFSISASLIMVSLIVISQLNFFSKKDLGYNENGVLLAKFGSEEMNTKRQAFVDAMLKLPEVKAVSFGPSLDGSTSASPLRLKEWPEEQVIQTSYFGVDYQLQDVLDLEIKEGRFFSLDYARDSVESILINERLAEMLGVDNPIGQVVQFERAYKIIGVFKNFHYKSLHHEIGPMALQMWLGQHRNILIKYQTENIGQTLQDMDATWKEVFGNTGFPFDYRFLDEQIQSMYHKEKEFASLLKVFTGLAIFLSLLGLFGLSSINIQQRIKQIGIRRILGAELPQIAKVVSINYLLTSILGILIAIPFAYYFMNRWLEGYAYSIDLDLTFPVFTFFIVVLVTTVTLAYQVYRVMIVNPSTILRDE